MKKNKKKKENFFEEFKKFICRGNVLDLAVGVIIGAAFSKIVTSLVNDIIMPLVGIIIGGIDFSSLTFHIKNATICYGLFLQNIVDFLIVAFCIFTFIKIINRLFNKKEEEKKTTKTDELKTLEEIRDLLKQKK